MGGALLCDGYSNIVAFVPNRTMQEGKGKWNWRELPDWEIGCPFFPFLVAFVWEFVVSYFLLCLNYGVRKHGAEGRHFFHGFTNLFIVLFL